MKQLFKVVIPARFDSGRLPGKVLEDIAGKPMIEHVVEAARNSTAEDVVVATDNDKVAAVVQGFGCRAIMTSPSHASGSDRIAEACKILEWDDATIVVNVQGDEPAIPSALIDQVATLLADHDQAVMATLSTPLLHPTEMLDPSMVKVVTDLNQSALYFSRAPIPWKRSENTAELDTSGFSLASRHLGIYAYQSGYIQQFSARPPCALEKIERLEQLRALWHGERIVCATAQVAPPPGVDTAHDLERMRSYFLQ